MKFNKLTVQVIAIGLLGALFFSSTNIINRWINVSGGNWVWTANLRFLFVVFLLPIVLLVFSGSSAVKQAWAVYKKNWLFLSVAGGIGYGIFYTTLCFAFSHASGWVVATTYELNMLFVPLVLWFFGKKINRHGLGCLLAIFIGVILVNISQAGRLQWSDILLGSIPVIISALTYPLGSQIFNEARNGGNGKFKIPDLSGPVMGNPLACVWLMNLGALPVIALFTVGAIFTVHQSAPTSGELIKILVITVSSGIIGASLFYYARHQLAKKTHDVMAIESTQAAEIFFTVVGEAVIVGGVFPGALGYVGLALVIISFIVFSIEQNKAS